MPKLRHTEIQQSFRLFFFFPTSRNDMLAWPPGDTWAQLLQSDYSLFAHDAPEEAACDKIECVPNAQRLEAMSPSVFAGLRLLSHRLYIGSQARLVTHGERDARE